MAELTAHWPGHGTVIRTLLDFFGDPGSPVPPAVHIHASSAARADALIASLFERTSVTSCKIDPLQVCSVSSVFERLVADLGGASSSRPKAHFDNLDLALNGLARALSHEWERKTVIVVKGAERMRDVWDEALSDAFWRLAELLGLQGRLCVVTISTLSIRHFRTVKGNAPSLGSGQPLQLRMSALHKLDALQLLRKDADQLVNGISSTPAQLSGLRALHEVYIGLAYDTLSADVVDEEEMRMIVAAIWHPFVVPVQTGEVTSTALPALLARSAPLFRDALLRVLPRLVWPQAWVRWAVAQARERSEAAVAGNERSAARTTAQRGSQAKRSSGTSMESASLARLETYIIIAAFLASFNPARLDMRYFLRDEHALLPAAERAEAQVKLRRKKGGAFRRKPKKKATADEGRKETLNSQALLGPKPFPVERLLAILQALLIESKEDTALLQDSDRVGGPSAAQQAEVLSRSSDVFKQINRLVTQRFLTRFSSSSAVLAPNVQLRCNVTHEHVLRLCKAVSFDLQEWLWDWAGGAGEA
ncbi:hypothetical protein IE81DRAFT_324149 [Ceraceosorus guamensis]|uniref:Origin recognition complex subunit 5 C-terminal domain-containing protein n=1 Tax=Ceraceosorus guamensis TaxID=1522189 RepID=A0A316VWI8_9BASI|nr:hypothetical protein IE81DRAFT_324149 [Ceraceosorus guamensis]PWN41812.1 hypothetical protein IE81DRAFT_324149 [Ceraceosorus guamensis]